MGLAASRNPVVMDKCRARQQAAARAAEVHADTEGQQHSAHCPLANRNQQTRALRGALNCKAKWWCSSWTSSWTFGTASLQTVSRPSLAASGPARLEREQEPSAKINPPTGSQWRARIAQAPPDHLRHLAHLPNSSIGHFSANANSSRTDKLAPRAKRAKRAPLLSSAQRATSVWPLASCCENRNDIA